MDRPLERNHDPREAHPGPLRDPRSRQNPWNPGSPRPRTAGAAGDQPRRLTSGGPTDLIWAHSLGLKGRRSTNAPHITIQRMEHVGVVVDDLAAATEFFVELGLVLQGEMPVEGRWVDRIVALEGVRADIAMMQTPDGNGRLELSKFHSPPTQGDNRHAPANAPGIRHIAFAVE